VWQLLQIQHFNALETPVSRSKQEKTNWNVEDKRKACHLLQDTWAFSVVETRAMEPEHKQFWMAGAGTKNF